MAHCYTRDANSHLLHSKWVSLFVVQVFLQVEEGVEEYVGHPAALQITKCYLTWGKKTGTNNGMCVVEIAKKQMTVAGFTLQ